MTPTSTDPAAATAAKRLDGPTLAKAKRMALQHRARRIRRSILGLTAAVFVTAFLVIFVQLASGHDPGLSKPSKAASGATHTSTTSASREGERSAASTQSSSSGSESSSATTPSSSGSGETTSSSAGSGSSASESSGSSGSNSAVTTKQS